MQSLSLLHQQHQQITPMLPLPWQKPNPLCPRQDRCLPSSTSLQLWRDTGGGRDELDRRLPEMELEPVASPSRQRWQDKHVCGACPNPPTDGGLVVYGGGACTCTDLPLRPSVFRVLSLSVHPSARGCCLRLHGLDPVDLFSLTSWLL